MNAETYIDQIEKTQNSLESLGIPSEHFNYNRFSLEELSELADAKIRQLATRRKFLGLEDSSKSDSISSTQNSPRIIALYADGGVIKKNPSTIGGTWAWCGVDESGNRVIEKYGAVPATAKRTVSNNHTEQIAITLALEAMPDGWSGTVYSDSQIALGRVFKGWRENNLPQNISDRTRAAVRRLGTIKTVLLQGHPTKADLECGIGKKRGYPVSIHNVKCDDLCKLAAKEYLQSLVVSEK